MGVRTGNPTWVDGTGGGTLITAARLNAVEAALDLGVGDVPLVPKVNSFLGPHAMANSGSTADALASGAQLPCSIFIAKSITVDQIGFNVDTAQAVNARALLYSSDSDGFPATLVMDSGGISCSTTGNKIGTITPLVLPAGPYWGFIRSNSGTTLRFRGLYQTVAPNVNDTFNNLTASGSALQADCGTYASPSATISSWTYNFNINTIYRAWVALRRSA